MGKIGRNDPCPCGSGKKYKKCCLEKEEEGKRNVVVKADFGSVDRGQPYRQDEEDYDSNGEFRDDEGVSADRWGEFWDQFDAAIPAARLDLARRLFLESGLDEDIVLDVFVEIRRELTEAGRSEELGEWADLIKRRHPDLFQQVSMYLGWEMLTSAMQANNPDLTRPLQLIVSGEESSIDILFDAVSRLFYHGRVEALPAILTEYLRRNAFNTEILDAAKGEMAVYALEATIACFMKDESWHDIENPEFWRAIDPLLADKDETTINNVKETVLLLGGRRTVPFTNADFKSLKTEEERNKLIRLGHEFAGYLHREKRWTQPRAMLGADEVVEYLIEKTTNKKRKFLLLPDGAGADHYLSSHCQILFPRPYNAAAFCVVLKPWMEFLVGKGYAAPEDCAARWDEILKRIEPLPALLENLTDDPPMIGEVKKCLGEE